MITYMITKTGKGIVKVYYGKRYHKGMIIGRFGNYILTRCKDRPNSNCARYQLFKQTEKGIEKLDLTRKENRAIKERILKVVNQ